MTENENIAAQARSENSPHRISEGGSYAPEENIAKEADLTDGEAISDCVPLDGCENMSEDSATDEEAPPGYEAAEDDCEAENCKDADAQPPEEAYTPLGKHDEILYKVYKSDTVYQILKILSLLCVALTVYTFIYRTVMLLPTAPLEAARYLVICGVPFVAVSIARKLINSKRPYEIYPFYKLPPKSKKGEGYPSRHVFSIFVIAATLAFENVFLGIALGLLGVLLAVCRVLLGIHFIKDTVVGAVIGVTSAILGMYITRLIF